MKIRRRMALGVSAIVAAGLVGVAVRASAGEALPTSIGAIESRIRGVAAAHPELCEARVVGRTREQREVLMLVLSGHGKNEGMQPAVLITGGLDSRHELSVETAIRICEDFCERQSAVLNDVTLYVIACANPDGIAAQFAGPRVDAAGVPSAIDDDRDGKVDEDPPVDLNADGMITVMRRVHPPIDDPPTVLADPKDARLVKAPDAAKGERPTYSLYVEGLDTDGDGLVAEDGSLTVELNRNFPHQWAEHVSAAGLFPLSQPECAAIADFVINHNNIFAAVTLGTCDNLINVPESGANDAVGAPRGLDAGDAGMYKEISELFKEVTGEKRAVAGEAGGSLHAWLYAHRGIPSFATNVWGRPDATAAPASTQAASGPETQPAEAGEAKRERAGKEDVKENQGGSRTEAGPGGGGTGGAGRRGGRGARGGEGGGEAHKVEQPKASAEDDAQWLEYSDRDRGGAGFVNWKAFDHPTLGSVEIGGFVPGFKFTPAVELIGELAQKQAQFITKLIERRPLLEIRGPVVRRLAPGVYEVQLAIANRGLLPSSTAIARRARSIKPMVVRISPDLEHVVSGQRMQITWGIDAGQQAGYEWIIRAEEGSEVGISLNGPDFANRVLKFKTTDNSDVQPATTQPLRTDEPR